MPITVVNSASVADGGAFTAGAGTQRMLVAVNAARHGSIDFTASAFAHGAASMSKVVEAATAAGGGGICLDVSIARLAHASILAGAQTYDVTHTTAPANQISSLLTLEGVDPLSPVRDSDIFVAATAGTTAAIPALTVAVGDCVVVAVANGANDVVADPTYSVLQNNTGASPRACLAYKLILAGTTETPAFTWTSNNRRTGAAVVFQAAAGVAGRGNKGRRSGHGFGFGF